MDQPLMDRSEIEHIVEAAKANRVKYLQDKVETGSSAVGVGGLAALVAYAFALFATHGHTSGS